MTRASKLKNLSAAQIDARLAELDQQEHRLRREHDGRLRGQLVRQVGAFAAEAQQRFEGRFAAMVAQASFDDDALYRLVLPVDPGHATNRELALLAWQASPDYIAMLRTQAEELERLYAGQMTVDEYDTTLSAIQAERGELQAERLGAELRERRDVLEAELARLG